MNPEANHCGKGCKAKMTGICAIFFISSPYSLGAYRKVARVIPMNSRFQARPLPGQAFFSFVLESKRGTSLKLKYFFLMS